MQKWSAGPSMLMVMAAHSATASDRALHAFAPALVVSDRASPSTADIAAVMAPIKAWLSGVANADALTIRDQMRIDGGGGATIVKRDANGATTVRRLTWEENLSYVKRGGQRLREWFVERPLLAIDGDIAMVWGAFAFSVDGKITHCGVDHFDLIREAGRWRVQNITWSQRRC